MEDPVGLLQEKNMPSKVAAPKNTGGGGFEFENDVCASLLACMLAGRPVLHSDVGPPVKLAFQTAPDKWYLDDVLIVSQGRSGEHRYSVSIKSNQQFSSVSAPPDFVETIWEQWLHIGSDNFQREQDYLGLFTATLKNDTKLALEGLIAKAEVADPATFASRLATEGWANDTERSLFESFCCPSDLSSGQTHTSDEETVRLLKRLRFSQYDFESVSSLSKKEALALCQSCVRTHSMDDAERLWTILRSIAEQYRPRAGTITLAELIQHVRVRLPLAEYPDYVGDWRKLEEHSQSTVSQVVDKIAGTIDIPCEENVRNIEAALASKRYAAVLGSSGTGKTVAARRLFERKVGNQERALWIDARSLDGAHFSNFEALFGTTNALSKLFGEAVAEAPILVLDGLDRLHNDRAFQTAGALLAKTCQEGAATHWQVVVPCNSREWPRVKEGLRRAGCGKLPWEEVQLGVVQEPQLKAVSDAIPALKSLVSQPRVANLMTNLKILDLVAYRALQGHGLGTSDHINESSVAEWFWDAEVVRGADSVVRGKFVRRLAQAMADTLLSSVAIDELEDGSLTQIASLQADHICVQIRGDRLSFSHDLYGEWARLRILQNNRDDLVSFVEQRKNSPLWNRPLRLFAAQMLEQDGGLEAWYKLLSGFSAKGMDGVADIVLETLVYTTDPAKNLNAALNQLTAENGRLLGRLLKRFRAFETTLDKSLLAALGEAGRKGTRVPEGSLWTDIIGFLYANRATVLALQPHEMAQIAFHWLSTASSPSDTRTYASGLAVGLGRLAVDAGHAHESPYSKDERTLFYRCMFLAARDFPGDVEELALIAAQRKGGSATSEEGLPGPWPNGPLVEVDPVFRTVVLEHNDFVHLYKSRSEAAAEVILATLIKEPRRTPWHGPTSYRGSTPVVDRNNWLPPNPLDGPFLSCLTRNFDVGARLIVTIVDLATEHNRAYSAAMETDEGDAGPRVVGLLEDGQRDFIGDENVFYWSEGANPPTYVVSSALMALEQYFYIRIEHGKDVSREVAAVFAMSKSVAIIGVLCDVGKRLPTLFEGPLRPLLSIAEIYVWDAMRQSRNRSHLSIVPPIARNWLKVKFAAYFNRLEHRRLDLCDIGVRIMLSRPEMAEFFARVLGKFAEEASSTQLAELFKKKVSLRLNAENYDKNDDGGFTLKDNEVSRRFREEAERVEASQGKVNVIILSLRCQRLIEEKTQLSDSSLAELWAIWIRVRGDADAQQGGPQRPEDGLGDEFHNAIAGCIAVFLRHIAWCQADASRLPEILTVLQGLLDVPAERSLDLDDVVGPNSWECFAAEAAAVLWSLDWKDRDLRQMVGKMVWTRKTAVIETLFRACAAFRHEARKDFSQLRRLALECSYLKVRLGLLSKFASQMGVGDDQREVLLTEMDEWATEKFMEFVEGTSTEFPTTWVEYENLKEFSEVEEARKTWRHPGFSLDVLHAAHTWLPLPDDALDEVERREVLEFCRATTTLLAQIARSHLDGDAGRHVPEGQSAFLETLGAVVAQMVESENPEFFWNVLFNVGADAHMWAEELSSAVHRYALNADSTPPSYTQTVGRLVRDSFGEPSQAPRWSAGESVWDALLGIDSNTQLLWQDRHTSVVNELSDVFELWMERVPVSRTRLANFAHWLARPAAASLRVKALIWYREAVRQFETKQSRDITRVADHVAGLLAVIWSAQQPELRRNQKAFVAFGELLDWLVKRQNATALQLLAEIGKL